MKFKGLTATIAAIALAAPLTFASAIAAPAPGNTGLRNGENTATPNAVTEMRDGHGHANGRHYDGMRHDGRRVDGHRNAESRVDSVNRADARDGRHYDGMRHDGRRVDGHRDAESRVDNVNRAGARDGRHYDGMQRDGRHTDGVARRNTDSIFQRNANTRNYDSKDLDGYRNGRRAVDGRVDGLNRLNDNMNYANDGVNNRVDRMNHRNDGIVNHRNADGATRRHRPFIRGYEDGNFRPDDPLTRAEFSQMLHNLYGGRNRERNVDRNAMMNTDGIRNYTRNVDGARSHNTFGRIYRNNAYNLSRNAINETRNTTNRMDGARHTTDNARVFGNVPHNHWAREEIRELHEMGYFSRIDGNRFSIDEPVTRAEFFEVLSHIKGRTITSDHHVHNNTTHGNGTITRAEAVAILHNLEGRPQEWTGHTRFNDVHESHPHHAHIMHAVNGH